MNYEKTKELVKSGHQLVVLLGKQNGMHEAASLVQRMAGQLDVLIAVLREKTKQCDQLAAENAGLKGAISQHAAGFTVCEACGEENVSGNDDVCRALNETPATKAFLREVRAQAITSALDSLDGVFDTDCVMETNGISYEEAEQRTTGALAVNSALIEFADQLRQGGAA
ncbi:hypothetical protein SMD51_002284 [Cronobacter sakazakii]|uniref:hypothetical protein n=1 Tax=Cronobacter sakazakii TaxID=28141 RepID=UPI0009B98DB8|nr:hypothetical protein [Cronobacter sakazakii]ELY2955868.1 hypothetical protein [Cronobacter sakazakii]ELZ3146628.1 hypothetical protein [Cronobacter sakazakii]EMA5529882.1 hypothetical protein [Cronobacter sakazakii]EMC4332219.1 hypothetical protein [Cronobacter sakazakii]EMD7613649.1 hypothetical protein [Cronobacter sakazakii]